MNQKNSLRLIVASLVVAIGLPQAAQAQQAVAVIVDTSPTSIAQTASLASINGQLAWLNMYLETGITGNGLIPLLSSINDKLGKVNANDGQEIMNEDVAARGRLYDAKIIEMKAAATPTQADFKRACIAITSRMTSGQGHGAARGASDAFRWTREMEAAPELRIKTPGTSAAKKADLVKDRDANGFCDENDIKNSFPGCSAEGDLPGADLRASSLTVGATNAPSDPSNGSLDEKQQAAARAYMLNTLPMPPVIPSQKALDTARGQDFLVSLNRYTSRQAASSSAMSNIIASHSAMPLTVNAGETSPLMKDWASRKEDWGRIFGPQIKFPESPSERDMMRYEVFSYYSGIEYQAMLATAAADDRGGIALAREQLRQQALANRIALQMLERQEDTNKLLAQILNQQLDPVTNQSLNVASAAAAK